MSEISTASREQDGGIEQINAALTEMDSVTQQNAALVQQTSSAASALEDQAQQLATLIATFRLDEQAPATSSNQLPAKTAVIKESVGKEGVGRESVGRESIAKRGQLRSGTRFNRFNCFNYSSCFKNGGGACQGYKACCPGRRPVTGYTWAETRKRT